MHGPTGIAGSLNTEQLDRWKRRLSQSPHFHSLPVTFDAPQSQRTPALFPQEQSGIWNGRSGQARQGFVSSDMVVSFLLFVVLSLGKNPGHLIVFSRHSLRCADVGKFFGMLLFPFQDGRANGFGLGSCNIKPGPDRMSVRWVHQSQGHGVKTHGECHHAASCSPGGVGVERGLFSASYRSNPASMAFRVLTPGFGVMPVAILTTVSRLNPDSRATRAKNPREDA